MNGAIEQDEIEVALRAGFAGRAHRTLDGAQVRRALAGATRTNSWRRRHTRWFAAAVAVVAVSVGVPAGVIAAGGHPDSQQPPIVVPAPPDATGTKLNYHPTWLPAGLFEISREVDATGSAREWGPTISGGQGSLLLAELDSSDPSWSETTANIGHGAGATTINGHPATISTTDAVFISWLPTPTTMLSIVIPLGANASAIGMQIADSVAPDPGSVVEANLSFGQLPPWYGQVDTAVQGNSPATAERIVEANRNQAATTPTGTPELRATVAEPDQKPSPLAGPPVTVAARGGTGTFVRASGSSRSELIAQLADGTWLTLTSAPTSGAPLDAAQLVAVADGMRIGSPADYSWLGR